MRGSTDIDAIDAAVDLRSLNKVITDVMARRDIHRLIRGDRLDRVVDSVVRLADRATHEEAFFALAVLGRIAAVARGRESQVFDRITELEIISPPSIDTLADGDTKLYAAKGIAKIQDAWVLEYLSQEALSIDTAEAARREILSSVLERCESLSAWLDALTKQSSCVTSMQPIGSRMRRIRRIFDAICKAAHSWPGDIGPEPGQSLSKFLTTFFKGEMSGLDSEVLFEAIDQILSVLNRVIQLRFSHALLHQTYSAVIQGKNILGPGKWAGFLRQSKAMPDIRTACLESAVVLARQNRTDRNLVEVLKACFVSRSQVAARTKKHFAEVKDIPADVSKFWTEVGEVTHSSREEQRFGNTEDEQIAQLLIEVVSCEDAMRHLESDVAPIVEISDPIMASSVKKAAAGYGQISQIVRGLARIRMLSLASVQGRKLEYNPVEHQLLGGHRTGVRNVKAIREGVRKDFGGRERTILKPLVEALD